MPSSMHEPWKAAGNGLPMIVTTIGFLACGSGIHWTNPAVSSPDRNNLDAPFFPNSWNTCCRKPGALVLQCGWSRSRAQGGTRVGAVEPGEYSPPHAIVVLQVLTPFVYFCRPRASQEGSRQLHTGLASGQSQSLISQKGAQQLGWS